MGDAVVAGDEHGSITFFNPAAEQVFGLSRLRPGATDGMFEHFPANDAEITDQAGSSQRPTPLAGALRGLTSDSADLLFRECPGGKDVWLSVTSRPLKNENGDRCGGVVVCRDVTARNEVEETLQSAKLTVEHANQAKTEFFAFVSHEIRTPMNAMLEMAELLWESTLDSEQRQYVEGFREAGKTLLRLVNDLLDISKIEAGKVDLETTPFDLRALAGEALELLKGNAHRKQLGIEFEFGVETTAWRGRDPTRLPQVLLNLLGNATKFTEKGEVKLSIRRSAQPSTQESNKVECVVSDTGSGIPEEAQQTASEDFKQADSSTTRGSGGTGLGLGICRRLVEQMGGTIAIVSQPGEGGSFSFTIDLTTVTSTQVASPRSQEDLQRHVLLFTRDSTQQILLRDVLSGWGFECEEAVSESEVLLRLNEKDAKRYSLLVLADAPSCQAAMTTAAEARRVRSGLAIAVLTAAVDAAEALRGREAGIACAVQTSVRHELLSLITKAIQLVEQSKPALTQAGKVAESPLMILVAEDNHANRLLLSAYLKGAPHTLEFAENGQLAVQQWRSKPFDLVLMDIRMPVMDGLAAVRAIRAEEHALQKTNATPIIALSANARAEDTDLSRKAGCTAHVSKPFSKQTLLRVIQEHGPSPLNA